MLSNRVTSRAFFADDGGFSTVGMVLALLISVSLLLGATQVYKIRSTAADVQNVADACALAAQSQVASFYIVAQVCDSAILTLSVAGVATTGIGVVAACVPGAQEFSVQLVETGHRILSARTRFAHACAEGLNKLQGLLPVFAAIAAASVAQANNNTLSDYSGLAVLCPLEGLELELALPEDEEEKLDNIEHERGNIEQAAQAAEEAAQAANECKRIAFLADCGSAPSYCMYERAEKLAGLHGGQNPYYASVDTWSFSVALTRAQLYYPQRLAQEAPTSSAVDEQARSALRRLFYAYAVEQMETAYVRETPDSFACHFPLLPKNTQELRACELYTREVFPLTAADNTALHLHAWEGCPQAAVEASAGVGSLAFLEAQGLEECPQCQLSAASLGKVAAASTAIENGFEYHYHIVAQQAAQYEVEYARYAEQARAVKAPAEGLFQTLKGLLSDSLNCRIEVFPPGRVGAIAIVCDTRRVSSADVIASTLVSPGASMGTRLAISGASLADDDASETDTVISALLDGFFEKTAAFEASGFVLDIWSGFLQVYSRGHQGLSEHIASALNALPLVGASGLGTWASTRFQELIDSAGFAPPDLVSHKPVLVNTYHITQIDQGSFSQGLLGAKQAFSHAYGGIAQDPLSAAVGIVGARLLGSYDGWDPHFVVARIELFGEGGPVIPLEISLPSAIKDEGRGLVESALDVILADVGQTVEVKRWE